MTNSSVRMIPITTPNPQSIPPWRPQGYLKLANLLGRYQEHAIFRRFGSLAMLNLMSLQAEILDLEIQLRDTIEEDDKANDTVISSYSRSFYDLHRSQPPNTLQ